MGKSLKQINKENARDEKVQEAAFLLFADQTIEGVSMGDIAKAAEIGRATLFRHYSNKTELAVAICETQWKAYLEEIKERSAGFLSEAVPAIARLNFVLECCIEMYQKHRTLLRYSNDLKHYMMHAKEENIQFKSLHKVRDSVKDYFHRMYIKAEEDKSFRTDISEDEFIRITICSLLLVCMDYADGFIPGIEKDIDYTSELEKRKEMIMEYVRCDGV